METVTLSISGMHCGGCVSSVTRVLRAVPGVQEVDVQLQPGRATVGYDASRVDRDALRMAVEDAGYEVTA